MQKCKPNRIFLCFSLILLSGLLIAQDTLIEHLKSDVCNCVENINVQIHSLQEIDILMAHCFKSAILSEQGKMYFGYSSQDIAKNIVQKNLDNWQQELVQEMILCNAFIFNSNKINTLKYDTKLHKGDGVIEALIDKYIYIKDDFGLDTFSIVDYKVIEFYDQEKMKNNLGKRVFFEFKKEQFLDGRKLNNIQSLNVYSEYELLYQNGKNHQLVAEKLDEIHSNDTSIYEYNIVKKYTSKIDLDEKIKLHITLTELGYRVNFLQAKNIYNLESRKLPNYTKSKYFLTLTIDSLTNLLSVEEHFNSDRKVSRLAKKRLLERRCKKTGFSLRSLPILALQYYCSLDPYYYLLSSIDGTDFSKEDSLKYSMWCTSYNSIMSQIGGCVFDHTFHLNIRIDEDQRKKAVFYNLDSISYISKYPFYSKRFVVENNTSGNPKTVKVLVKDKIDGNWETSNHEIVLEKISYSDSLIIKVYSKYILKSKIATYSINYKSSVLSEKLDRSIKSSFLEFKERNLRITNKYELQEDQLLMRVLAMVGTIAEWNEYCKLTLPISSDKIDTDFNQYLQDKSLEDIFKDLNIFYTLKR